MSVIAGMFLVLLNFFYFHFAQSLGFDIYGDKNWYVEAGYSILRGNYSLDILFFSPLHSLSAALGHYIELNFSNQLTFVFRSLYCFFLGVCIFDFSRLLYSTGLLRRNYANILCIGMLVNPYVVRYSSGIYPEFYSLLAGILMICRVVLHHQIFSTTLYLSHTLDSSPVIPAKACADKFKFGATFIEKISNSSDLKFASLMILLCFFRYSLLITVLPYFYVSNSFRVREYFRLMSLRLRHFLRNSIVLPVSSFAQSVSFDFKRYPFNKMSGEYLADFFRVENIVYPLILLVSGILAAIFAEMFGNGTNGIFSNFSLCRSFQSVFLLLGFREAFWSATSCMGNFAFESYKLAFIDNNIGSGHLANYIISLCFGTANLTFTLYGLRGVYKMRLKSLCEFVSLSVFALLCTVFLLSLGHYRYFIPLMPAIYLGFCFQLAHRKYAVARR